MSYNISSCKSALRRRQPRHFMLLEIIIALFLLTLFISPLITPHLLLQKAQIACIEKIHIDRIAAEYFVDIKEKFFKQEIPLQPIPIKRATTEMTEGQGYTLSSLPMEVSIPRGTSTSHFNVTCELFQKSKDPKIHLIYVKLLFVKGNKIRYDYDYLLTVETPQVGGNL